LSTPEILKFK